MNTLRAFLFPVGLAAAVAARAEYPEKPVTIVVPFAAGGPTDKAARDLGEAMRKHLGGQSIVIDNTAGAGGTIASNKVAKAPNDVYTLLLHHLGPSTAPSLYRTLPYKTLDDFEDLGMINEVPMTLIGRPTLAPNNHAELAKWTEANKARPTSPRPASARRRTSAACSFRARSRSR